MSSSQTNLVRIAATFLSVCRRRTYRNKAISSVVNDGLGACLEIAAVLLASSGGRVARETAVLPTYLRLLIVLYSDLQINRVM